MGLLTSLSKPLAFRYNEIYGLEIAGVNTKGGWVLTPSIHNELTKPLMPVGDRPILEIIINQLKADGFDSVILAVGHLHDFAAHFQDGRNGLSIEYSVEKPEQQAQWV